MTRGFVSFLEENWRERTRSVNTEVTEAALFFVGLASPLGAVTLKCRFIEKKFFLNLEHKPHGIKFVIKES